MSFAPVQPRNLRLLDIETVSDDRVRAKYSLDLPEPKYVVAGVLFANPFRYGPTSACAKLNKERTRYTSYDDFLALAREDGDIWKIDASEKEGEEKGNQLVEFIRRLNSFMLFNLSYQPLPDGAQVVPDPWTAEFDVRAVQSLPPMLKVLYFGDMGMDEFISEVGEPVMRYIVEVLRECR